MIAVDTNLLGRLTDSRDPQCATARHAVHTLFGRGEVLVVFPQIIYEFWAVATRPAGRPPAGQNGLGMTCQKAQQWIRFFRRRFRLLADQTNLVDFWLRLVANSNVRGNLSHDARIAAAMQSHSITELLTFNASDFKSYPIAILDPSKVP